MNKPTLVKYMVVTINHKETGKRMRTYRKFHNHSLREVARYMGLSATFISDLERGNRRWTEKLADIFIKAIETLNR